MKRQKWKAVRKARGGKTRIPDLDDSWALVELYRWQYGQLPMDSKDGELDISIALKNLAEAIEAGESRNFPTPFNMVMILKYLSKFEYQNIFGPYEL